MLSNKKPKRPVIMPHRVMTSRQHKNYTAKAVSEVDKFSGITCSVISCLVVEIFAQKKTAQ